jgi:hypothetical protein
MPLLDGALNLFWIFTTNMPRLRRYNRDWRKTRFGLRKRLRLGVRQSSAAFIFRVVIAQAFLHRVPLEFMGGLSYTTIIKPAVPLAGRRGSVLGH